ncbi:MAG TPA: hypothetical protein DIU15_03140, partial [Deltaproteobacteria bacterium]|nr:hypothetical protein [Deltaproteobacteria bacterium]
MTRWRYSKPLVASLGLAVLLCGQGEDAGAADRYLFIEGLLNKDDTTGRRLELRVLRADGQSAQAYRVLSGLYVARAPSDDAWDEVVAPALVAAMDSPRPIESLRSTLLGMEDALVAGPEEAGVRLTFDLPGDRGQGFVSLVAPVVIGPDSTRTAHREPNQFGVLTGVAVDEAMGDRPVLEAIGFKSAPDMWTGDDLRRPRTNQLPQGGMGAWTKFRGRSYADEEDASRVSVPVTRTIDRAEFNAASMRPWPGTSKDKEGVGDLLAAARYRTRVVDSDGRLLDALRLPHEELYWADKRVKHPTRYGIATFPITAEIDEGEGLEVREDILIFVFFYTPLFLPFDGAHLYASTSPEFFVKAVQKGELPFFERDGRPYFYRGHVDRWIRGEAIEHSDDTYSRKRVGSLIDEWASSESDSQVARAIEQLGRNPANWPVRLIERYEEEERAYKVNVVTEDLASWLHQLKRSIEPDVELLDPVWTLSYSGEAASVNLGVVLSGGSVELEPGAGQVASMEPSEAPVRRKARDSKEGERRSGQERSRRDSERDEEARRRSLERREEEERRQEKERRRAEAERRRAADRRRAEADRRREMERRDAEYSRRREAEERQAEAERRRERERRQAGEDR